MQAKKLANLLFLTLDEENEQALFKASVASVTDEGTDYFKNYLKLFV